MSTRFQFKAKNVLITYAQSPDLDPMEIEQHLRRLGAECIIGKENHADGGIHFHVFAQFGEPYRSSDPRIFDVGGRHPNILPGRKTPEKMYDYAVKDGDIVGGTLERPSRARVESASDKWSEIISQPSREEFFDAVARLDPKSLCCSFNSITKYADWAYRIDRSEYSTPNGVEICAEGVPALVEWVRGNLGGNRQGMFFFQIFGHLFVASVGTALVTHLRKLRSSSGEPRRSCLPMRHLTC